MNIGETYARRLRSLVETITIEGQLFAEVDELLIEVYQAGLFDRCSGICNLVHRFLELVKQSQSPKPKNGKQATVETTCESLLRPDFNAVGTEIELLSTRQGELFRTLVGYRRIVMKPRFESQTKTWRDCYMEPGLISEIYILPRLEWRDLHWDPSLGKGETDESICKLFEQGSREFICMQHRIAIRAIADQCEMTDRHDIRFLQGYRNWFADELAVAILLKQDSTCDYRKLREWHTSGYEEPFPNFDSET